MPKRFIFAPAYLKGKEIATYGPAWVTDLLYAKTHAEVVVRNQPLPLSPYKRVRFTIQFADEHGLGMGKNALRYALYEYSRHIGTYPLDTEILQGGQLILKKTQTIKFLIEPQYAHLIALV